MTRIHGPSNEFRPRAGRVAGFPAFLLLPILLSACSSGGTEPTLPALRLQLPAQPIAAEVGTEVPLRIRVADPKGVGQPDLAVSWLIGAGSGKVRPLGQVTDDDGYASAAWTLGTAAGDQTLTVRVQGEKSAVAEIITATARPGAIATLNFPGDTTILTAYRQTRLLAPRVADRFGNPADPAALEWLALDPAIVSVDAEGRSTAHQPGTAAVVARSGELADTANLVVDPKGVITITFDDGFRSTYEIAYPLLKERGLRANVGVVREYSERDYKDYLTLAQLRELSAAGWSMVSHSVTHPFLDSIPLAQLRAELVESKAWLDKHQFRGSSIFIVPYHSWGERELELIREHYQAARGLSVRQFWPDSIVQWMPADPYALTSIEPMKSTPKRPTPFDHTTVAGRNLIRSYLERVTERGEFVDIFFHQIPPEEAAAFAELVKLLAEYKEWILPYHELFENDQ
jgi:hypothetical protein